MMFTARDLTHPTARWRVVYDGIDDRGDEVRVAHLVDSGRLGDNEKWTRVCGMPALDRVPIVDGVRVCVACFTALVERAAPR